MTPERRLPLARLLQLASPTLPVGAFSYSQGLEAAIEARVVTDAATASRWLEDVAQFSLGTWELPILARLLAAWRHQDLAETTRWNARFLASRESAELRAETVQMGYSLARLMTSLELAGAGHLAAMEEPAFPTAFALACVAWEIAPDEALATYLWSWLENGVMAAVKAVPLGQTDGQRLLMKLGARIEPLVAEALALEDEALANALPRLAILSARHETQYSRLFRS